MPAKIEFNEQEMGERYIAGESSCTLAIAYNVSETTIFNRLKKLGIPRRKSGPLPIYDEAKICEMYESGMEIQEIKDETGAKSVATFYAILHKHGVKLRLQRYKRDDPETHARIIELRNQELSHQKIADIIGINRNYVSQILNLNQEIHLERKRWQKSISVKRDMTIQEMHDAGAFIQEIAEIKQMTPVEIFDALKRK